MQIVRHQAYARAALVGNPSDGYGGKTISVILPHFSARVVLYEWDQIELIPSQEDQSRFSSLRDLVDDVRRSGYYGGIRLVKATIKRFAEYCTQRGLVLPERNFSVRYESNIPRQVGLAGSSAIVVATLRCLIDFFGIGTAIPLEVQASLALSVETEELGLPAGLQDRVVQVYEGVVYMDFTELRDTFGVGYLCGKYERLERARMPSLYVAYRPDAGKPRQVRFDRDSPHVIATMRELARLTDQARAAILAGNLTAFDEAVNGTLDVRRRLYDLRADYLQMVECARAAGASANFAGSGGAISGSYRDAAMFVRLKASLEEIGCKVLQL